MIRAIFLLDLVLLALTLTGCGLMDGCEREAKDPGPAKVVTPWDSIADPYPEKYPPSPKVGAPVANLKP